MKRVGLLMLILSLAVLGLWVDVYADPFTKENTIDEYLDRGKIIEFNFTIGHSGEATEVIFNMYDPFSKGNGKVRFSFGDSYSTIVQLKSDIVKIDLPSLQFDNGPTPVRLAYEANRERVGISSVTINGVVPNPEPSTWLLLGTFLGVGAIMVRRQRKQVG